MSKNIEQEVMIKSQMIRKNLNVSKLAKMLNVSIAYVSDIIKGNRNPKGIKEKMFEILELELELNLLEKE